MSSGTDTHTVSVTHVPGFLCYLCSRLLRGVGNGFYWLFEERHVLRPYSCFWRFATYRVQYFCASSGEW